MNEPRDKNGTPWKLWQAYLHLQRVIANPPAIQAEKLKEQGREGDDVPF